MVFLGVKISQYSSSVKLAAQEMLSCDLYITTSNRAEISACFLSLSVFNSWCNQEYSICSQSRCEGRGWSQGNSSVDYSKIRLYK
jgi:hypothetical protein